MKKLEEWLKEYQFDDLAKNCIKMSNDQWFYIKN